MANLWNGRRRLCARRHSASPLTGRATSGGTKARPYRDLVSMRVSKTGCGCCPDLLDELGYHRINATGKDGAPRYNHHYSEFARLKKQKYFPRQ